MEAVWGGEGYREESAIESGFKGAYGIMNELGCNYNYDTSKNAASFVGAIKIKNCGGLRESDFFFGEDQKATVMRH